jgi:hypothetical protein
MDISSAILDLVVRHSARRKNRVDHDDILGSVGMAGDDAGEFLEAFAKEFSVDFSDFLWYLHYNANEPPFVRTVWGVDKEGRRIPDIPIRLADLVSAAESGKWRVVYPAHSIARIPQWSGLLFAALLLLLLTALVIGLLK